MAVAARAFLNGLAAGQLGSVQYANLGDPTRTKWSNFPAGAAARPGIALGDLTESQRVLLHDLLRASTSSQGYLKMTGAMRADQVLYDLQGGNEMFGTAHYNTTVFGSPENAHWAWGHHMSAMFTVAGDRTAFTPGKDFNIGRRIARMLRDARLEDVRWPPWIFGGIVALLRV